MSQERDLESLILLNNPVNPEISGTPTVEIIKAETPNASRKSFLSKLTSATAIATIGFLSTPAISYASDQCSGGLNTLFFGLAGFYVGTLIGRLIFEDEVSARGCFATFAGMGTGTLVGGLIGACS